VTPLPPSRPARLALLVLAAGALGIIVAVQPCKTFELDRFFVPKELVLHVTAMVAGLLALRGVDRLRLSSADDVLAAFFALTVLSSLFAPNWYLAFRSVAITGSSLVVFWSCRRLAREGLARPLLIVLAAGTVLGAVTALLQVYGVETDSFSQNRAPGGTFGNRNFMAHLAAIGLPLVVALAVQARSRIGPLLGGFGVMILAGAMVLSRSRAAWLAALTSMLFLAMAGLWRGGLWTDPVVKRRVIGLGAATGLGLVLALAIPNSLDWRSDSPYLETLQGVANFREGSGHGRVVQYRNTLRMTLAHPLLGVGPGNWSVVYPSVAPKNDPSLDRDDGMTANPWPSSDWMTFLAERGPRASLLLLLALLSLGVKGWRWWRESARRAQHLEPLALPALLIAGMVCGSFDAVLVLPVPALYIWAAAGLLAAPEAGGRIIEPDPRRRQQLVIAFALVAALFVTRSALQAGAMEVYDQAWKVADAERAARLDPGSYRIRMFLAQRYFAKGECPRVLEHARAANRLYPSAPRPQRLIRACGGRESR
jgi:hypothetical protein